MKKFIYNDYVLSTYEEGDQAIAVIDTGTSLALFPSDIYDSLTKMWASQFSPSEFQC